MEELIIAHLEGRKATNIIFDGAWVTFTNKDGSQGYASQSDLYAEWKCGR